MMIEELDLESVDHLFKSESRVGLFYATQFEDFSATRRIVLREFTSEEFGFKFFNYQAVDYGVVQYYAVTYFDLYVSRTKSQELKYMEAMDIMLCCTVLAFKMILQEEFDVEEFVHEHNFEGDYVFNFYDSGSMADYEFDILEALDFRLDPVTPISFLDFFISGLNFLTKLEQLSFRTSTLCFAYPASQSCILFAKYLPSVISATCLLYYASSDFDLYEACYKAIARIDYINKMELDYCIKDVAVNMMVPDYLDGEFKQWARMSDRFIKMGAFKVESLLIEKVETEEVKLLFELERRDCVGSVYASERYQIFSHVRNKVIRVATQKQYFHYQHMYNPVVRHYAVTYFDFYVSRTTKKELVFDAQKCILCCSILAWKMLRDDFDVYLYAKDINCLKLYKEGEIGSTERLILEVLDHRLSPITPLSFIDYFIKLCDFRDKGQLIKYCTVGAAFPIIQSYIQFAAFCPSTVSAAGLLLIVNQRGQKCYNTCYKAILSCPYVDKGKLESCIELLDVCWRQRAT